jgi:hypothetical protein
MAGLAITAVGSRLTALTLGAVAELALLAPGCVAPTSEEVPQSWGTSPLPRATCVGNADGRIDAEEVAVALDPPLAIALLVGRDATGLPARDGAQALDGLSTADQQQIFAAASPPDGEWWAAAAPGVVWSALLDHERGTLGLFTRDEAALRLLGLASVEENRDLLLYDPPVDLLRFPAALGDTFATDAAANGLSEFVAYPRDLSGNGIVSLRHRYTVAVSAGGPIATPAADLHGVRIDLTVRTEAWNSIAGLFAADSERVVVWFAECIGMVGRARSYPDEQDPDFANAAAFWRFGLDGSVLP